MSKIRQPTLADAAILLALLFVGVQLVQALVGYLNLAGNAIRFPYPLDYGEGPVLDQVLRLARGVNIYPTDLSTPPWNVTNTPPLFQLVQIPFAASLSFAAGRAISVVSALAAAVAITLIMLYLTRDWIASILAGLLLFAFPHVTLWSVLDRADTLGLALSLIGMWVAIRFGRRTGGVAIAAMLFVLAALTKSLFIFVAPAASVVYLLGVHARRQAALLMALTLGSTALVYAALSFVTSGGFLFQLITASSSPIVLPRLVDAVVNVGIHAAFIIFGGVIYMMLDRTMGFEPSHALGLVLSYSIFAFIASVSSAKDGASWNDTYELVVAVCMLSGAAIAWFGRNPWFKVVALLVLTLQLTGLSEWTNEEVYGAMGGRFALRRDLDQMNTLIQNVHGRVLVDEFVGLLPLNGYRIDLQPLEFKQLSELGAWNEAPLIDQINHKHYAAILVYAPINGLTRSWQSWTRGVRTAVLANYKQTDRNADTIVYTPN